MRSSSTRRGSAYLFWALCPVRLGTTTHARGSARWSWVQTVEAVVSAGCACGAAAGGWGGERGEPHPAPPHCFLLSLYTPKPTHTLITHHSSPCGHHPPNVRRPHPFFTPARARRRGVGECARRRCTTSSPASRAGRPRGRAVRPAATSTQPCRAAELPQPTSHRGDGAPRARPASTASFRNSQAPPICSTPRPTAPRPQRRSPAPPRRPSGRSHRRHDGAPHRDAQRQSSAPTTTSTIWSSSE